MHRITKNICKSQLLNAALFVFGLAFLIWRAPYGFCFNDEPFCVTLAQRLWLGDGLIVDEWHGVQNFGTVLLPFYALFRCFFSSNDGILLVFRYTYCLLWWGVCSITYIKLFSRFSENRKTAIAAYVYLILFSPLDYMTLSYTSIGLMSALLICLQLYLLPCDQLSRKPSDMILFSVLWVVLVLCSPAMAAGYILLLLISFAGRILEKKHGKCFYFQNLFLWGAWSVLLIGMIAAIYLYAFVLSRGSLFEALENLPYLFDDPEHSSMSFLGSVSRMHRRLFDVAKWQILGCVVCFVAGYTDKLRKLRLPLFILCIGLYFYYQTIYFVEDMWWRRFNFQMFHIVFLGAAAFALLKKRPYKLFLTFYGGSYVYTLLNNVVTNTGTMAISMTLSIAGAAGIIFIGLLLKELQDAYRNKPVLRQISVVLICGTLLAQILSQGFIRFYRTYWDSPLYQLTTTIQTGAAKGLKTSPDTAYQYEAQLENLVTLLSKVDTEGKSFLSCTSSPCLYLDADLEFATFSAWTFGYDENLNGRILDYQRINPEEIPDIIFCAAETDILPICGNGYRQLQHNGAYLFVKE